MAATVDGTIAITAAQLGYMLEGTQEYPLW